MFRLLRRKFSQIKIGVPSFCFFPLFAKNASKQPSSVVEKYKFLPFHDQRVEDEKKKKRGRERKVEEAFRRLNSSRARNVVENTGLDINTRIDGIPARFHPPSDR